MPRISRRWTSKPGVSRGSSAAALRWLACTGVIEDPGRFRRTPNTRKLVAVPVKPALECKAGRGGRTCLSRVLHNPLQPLWLRRSGPYAPLDEFLVLGLAHPCLALGALDCEVLRQPRDLLALLGHHHGEMQRKRKQGEDHEREQRDVRVGHAQQPCERTDR